MYIKFLIILFLFNKVIEMFGIIDLILIFYEIYCKLFFFFFLY